MSSMQFVAEDVATNPDAEDPKRQPFSSLNNLQVWQDAVELTEMIYAITGTFPEHEQQGLTTEWRLAAVTVSARIAEGKARYNAPQFMECLLAARGGLFEVVTLSRVCHSQQLVTEEQHNELEERCDKLTRRLSRLINTLKNQTDFDN